MLVESEDMEEFLSFMAYLPFFYSLISVVVQQSSEKYLLTCWRYFKMQINLQWIVSDLCSAYAHLPFNQIKFNIISFRSERIIYGLQT